jgi:HK97 family phage prohead protease
MEYEVLNRPFEIKADDVTEEGTFKGYASTFGGKPDFGGDIIAFGAFAETIRKNGKFGNGIGMLKQHNHDLPIGKWMQVQENAKGLQVIGQLALKTVDGHDVHEFMKLGIMNALSIGWEPLKIDYDGNSVDAGDAISIDPKKNIRTLKKIDLWEISPVLFPMNPKARITGVKAAIEEAKTIRELEGALKEAGLSNSASKYIIGLCKNNLHLREEDENGLNKILKSLESANREFALKKLVFAAEEFQREVGIKMSVNASGNK